MAKKRDWRKLVSIQDVGDIIALVNGFRSLLGQKGREIGHQGKRTTRRFQRGIRRSRTLENAAELGNRLSKLIARKQREWAQASQEVGERIQHEVRHTTRAVEQVVEKSVEKKVLKRRQQDQRETGVFVTGTILGTLIGIALAIWFAPQSGEKTRRDIEQAAIEARQRIEGESIADAIQDGKTEARKFRETTAIR